MKTYFCTFCQKNMPERHWSFGFWDKPQPKPADTLLESHVNHTAAILHAATAKEQSREEQVLRRLLAYRVAGALLYTDGGELQDSTFYPYVDFKRDSVDEIERKLGERTRASIKLARLP
jgi:hypothetical protein